MTNLEAYIARLIATYGHDRAAILRLIARFEHGCESLSDADAATVTAALRRHLASL